MNFWHQKLNKTYLKLLLVFLLGITIIAVPFLVRESTLHIDNPLSVNRDIELTVLRESDSPALFNLVSSEKSFFDQWDKSISKVYDTLDSTEKRLSLNMYSDNMKTLGICYQDKLVGMIQLRADCQSVSRVVIGYFISQKYQGKGIMFKSCTRLIKYLFDSNQASQIVAAIGDHNTRSLKLISRLGFKSIDKKTFDDVNMLDNIRKIELRDGISLELYSLDKKNSGMLN